MAQHERTLKMKQEYKKLHDAGMSVRDIAKKFNLHWRTVYKYLDEIAEQEGVPREDLLFDVEKAKPRSTYDRAFAPVEKIDLTEYRANFDAAKKGINQLGKAIDSYLEKEEEYDQN